MAQAPARVEVHRIESAPSRSPPATAFNSVAPALANAIFANTTVRVQAAVDAELLRML